MAKIKGQNFRVEIESACVPEATNCSISLTGNAESSSTKDTEGLFEEDTIVSTSWTAKVDTFQSTVAQIREIITLFKTATDVNVGWDQTAGLQNRIAQNASFSRHGKALLTDVSFTFNDRQTVATSLQFQGTGGLT